MRLLFYALVVFAFIYAAMDMGRRGMSFDVASAFDRELAFNSLAFSLEQIVRPFYVWGSSAADLFNGRIPIRAKWLATLQSVISLGLLSLSLLAVNWRFKRD